MRIRKHYDRLAPAERQRLVQALLALKDDGRYDEHVRIYQRATCWARRGPAFLPWHRHLLLRFEEDLRSAEPDVTLPYWDFCRDRSTQASLWDEDFMGGDGRPHDGMVITGPFATEAGAWPLMNGGFLVRRLGRDPLASTLPTADDLEHALGDARYDEAPWDSSAPSGFRNRIEGWVRGPALHNRVHAWVGGVMSRDDAPDDPLFWLVHAFIDKQWSDWQQRHPGVEYRPQGEGPLGHNLDDAMWPWNGGERPEIVAPFHDAPVTIRPRDLLDHRALGYAYDTDPDVGSGGVFTTLAVGEEHPTFGFGEDVPTTLAFGEESLPVAPRPDPAHGQERVGSSYTTLAVGEEGPRPTTLAIGEEGPRPTTLAIGEEGPQPTTHRWGEEDPQPTTLAIGEEGPRPTTLMVGEEEPRDTIPTTQALGEEGPLPPGWPTTLAFGEEDRVAGRNPGAMTTLAIGEESPQPTTLQWGEEDPQPTTMAGGEEDVRMTTLAVGEEETPVTTMAVGEEGPPMTTLAVGEEQSPTTEVQGEEDDPSARGGPFGRF